VRRRQHSAFCGKLRLIPGQEKSGFPKVGGFTPFSPADNTTGFPAPYCFHFGLAHRTSLISKNNYPYLDLVSFNNLI
jgi:hypothetical protein